MNSELLKAIQKDLRELLSVAKDIRKSLEYQGEGLSESAKKELEEDLNQIKINYPEEE